MQHAGRANNLGAWCAASVQDYTERRALRSELRTLAKEERSRQQKAIGEVCLSIELTALLIMHMPLG